jgi:hypothetical protein
MLINEAILTPFIGSSLRTQTGNEHSWALPGIFPIRVTVRKFAHKLINPLNTELNPICHLLALLGAHRILHIRKRVKCVLFMTILLYFGTSYLNTRATLNFVTNFDLQKFN